MIERIYASHYYSCGTTWPCHVVHGKPKEELFNVVNHTVYFKLVRKVVTFVTTLPSSEIDLTMKTASHREIVILTETHYHFSLWLQQIIDFTVTNVVVGFGPKELWFRPFNCKFFLEYWSAFFDIFFGSEIWKMDLFHFEDLIPVRFSGHVIKNRTCNTITIQRWPLTSDISGLEQYFFHS